MLTQSRFHIGYEQVICPRFA